MRSLLLLVVILALCGYVAADKLNHQYALEDRV